MLCKLRTCGIIQTVSGMFTLLDSAAEIELRTAYASASESQNAIHGKTEDNNAISHNPCEIHRRIHLPFRPVAKESSDAD